MESVKLSRREFLQLSAAAVTGTMIAACQPAAAVPQTAREAVEPAAEKVTVNFMARGDEAIFNVFRELKAVFEEQNPNIEVDIDETPEDYFTKLQVRVAGGTPPDCDFSNDSDILNLARQGVYQPLDPFLDVDSRWNPDDFYPISLFNGVYQGELYHLPYDGGSVALYYNKDLFDAEGLEYPDPEQPLTFDQYLELALGLTRDMDDKRPGEEGFDGTRIKQYGCNPKVSSFWTWVWWNDGEIFAEQDRDEWTTCVLDQPAAYEGLQWAADLGVEYLCAPTPVFEQSTPLSFFAGNVAMDFAGVWSNVRMRQAAHDWDVAPLIQGVRRIPIGEYSGLSMIKTGKNKEAAYEWIWFGTSEEGQEIVSRLGQDVPARKALARTDVFLDPTTKPEHDQVFLDELEHPDMRSVPYWPYFREMQDIVSPVFDQVWRGKISAEEACNELAPKLTHLAETGEVT